MTSAHHVVTRQRGTGYADGGFDSPKDESPSIQPGTTERDGDRTRNVGNSERAVSVAAGAILGALAIGRRGLPGLLIGGVGAALLYRGATGNCAAYRAMHVDSRRDDDAPRGGSAHVVQSFTVNRPRSELYGFWRNLENLPRFMPHLESVRVVDDRRSHWVAKAPSLAGGRVEWDAEILRDDRDEEIAWRSLPGSDVTSAGSVRFTPAAGDRGTVVRAVIEYAAPAGRLGTWIATAFGQSPEHEVREGLRSFKQTMELGETPTISGQPRGTCAGRGRREP